jgi:hypothetical protein
MKRAFLIIALGFFVAVAAFCAVFYSSTAPHREVGESSTPELAWLKKEFSLGSAEFERISKLHAAYQPHCREMCRRIDQQNAKLRRLVSASSAMTPEIQNVLAEAARLRADCQTMMLNHFYEVSRSMPPAQGRRYLDWVQEKTFLPAYVMSGSDASSQ